MLEGKMSKFYEEVCLLDQPFIKEASQTITQLIATKVAKLGENISVRRFARFKVGDPNWTVATTRPPPKKPKPQFQNEAKKPGRQFRAFFAV